MKKIKITILLAALLVAADMEKSQCETLNLEGVTVTPHLQSQQMRYRKKTDFSLGARIQLFIQNMSKSPLSLEPDTDIRLRDRTPKELLEADEWAWYDFPDAWKDQSLTLAPEALTVWTWNGKREQWGVGTSANMIIKLPEREGGTVQFQVPIKKPQVWLSAVTFLGEYENPFPDRLIFHVANHRECALRLESCRLWLPENNSSWRILLPQKWISEFEAFPKDRIIPAGDRAGAIVSTGILPLTYAALEVRLLDPKNEPVTLWAHLRIKREVFDISGGWVTSRINGRSALTFEPYLKTLRRMHINTGHIGEVDGYTDIPELYSRYPLKRFNKLSDFKRYDTDSMLKHIHAVEFLGEPQYGGGRPVHPMEVWRKLTPYQSTRLATTVTHSEERIWRFYAGLSDYPHYDAYRVCAPSPDSWRLYDRWGDERIRWGAPLETIGEMTRSLRELNRPATIAYWSQGAHSGWGNYGGRQRTSPTPQELRAQAYHALAARITSLYWFNLSLKSILKFPDLIEPVSIVGREIRLLENYYLEGDAYYYERLAKNGKPDWDISVIASPEGAVLFALDIDYKPDTTEKVFKFAPPRDAEITFPLPVYLRNPARVLRVDASEIKSVPFESTPKGVRIKAKFGDVNVFVAAHNRDIQKELEQRRKELEAFEDSFGFDPARNSAHLEQLKAILEN
ncbi:MAG: hypothetical protein ACYSTT_11960 [Planctomycetota bacterium]|jgi:hypothetical protein